MDELQSWDSDTGVLTLDLLHYIPPLCLIISSPANKHQLQGNTHNFIKLVVHMS